MKNAMKLISVLMLSAALAGCGTNTQPEAEASDAPAAAVEEVKEPETEIEAESETEAVETPSTETAAPAAAGDVDVSSAIDASTTTDATAIPLGQWGKTARYATEDETYHTVYMRINKITTQTDDAAYVQEAVDLHNSVSYDFQQLDLSSLELPDDVELCVVDYDIYVPAEFPEAEYGLADLDMSFSQSNIGGGGIPSADGTSTYIGMGTNTEDLATEAEPEYHAGNTYTLRCIYTMVKGYTDYVFDFTSYPDGTKDTSVDVMYHAYFACK